MPIVAQFRGIKICLFFNDHAPPHFHAFYGSYESLIEIRTGRSLAGKLPKNAEKLVERWRVDNLEALLENWQRVERLELPRKIGDNNG